tara:strand:- start:374 stop:901 length:528 start_codon:yes stop_codon:yes gene_type:complete
MKILFSATLFFSISFSADYRLENSKITYFGDHYLHKWEGSTSDVSGDVFYDENKKQYNCSVTVALSTFSSGNDSRDSNMLIYCKAFDFPNIIFESASIKVNENSLDIEGIVEFAGKKKKIKSIAQLNNLQGNQFSVEGEFGILLSDFDIERPSLLFVKMEDLVVIKYSIQGVQNE